MAKKNLVFQKVRINLTLGDITDIKGFWRHCVKSTNFLKLCLFDHEIVVSCIDAAIGKSPRRHGIWEYQAESGKLSFTVTRLERRQYVDCGGPNSFNSVTL